MTSLVAICLAVLSPARDDIRACIADLERNVPQQNWTSTRYLSLSGTDPEHADELRAMCSFVVNSISRSAVIVRPVAVDGGRLLRLDLVRLDPTTSHGFGRDEAQQSAAVPLTQAWESLVSDDPYYHIRSQVIDPATSKTAEVYTDGGWVDLAAAAKLREMTGSGGAVLRADWFVAVACQPPHYYTLAGVPGKRDQWFAELGLDAETIIRLRANRGANLTISGITGSLRRISRWPGPLGYIWHTYDTADAVADKDPFRNPTFTNKFDAGEHIAARANGMLSYALFDFAGKRQNGVPPNIAVDDTIHPATELVPMLSCIRCHAVGDGAKPAGGLRSFYDEQSKLLAGQVRLYANDPVTLEKLAAFYGRQERLQRELDRDREDYERAVERTTGLDAQKSANALAGVFRRYALELVDLETAARELGLSAEDARTRLAGASDIVILSLLEGGRVQRKQWEQAYAEAALLGFERGKP